MLFTNAPDIYVYVAASFVANLTSVFTVTLGSVTVIVIVGAVPLDAMFVLALVIVFLLTNP